MKAFQVDDPATGITSIVYHQTAGKARYATYKSASSAGWDVVLIDMAVRRRPDLDGAVVFDDGKPEEARCYAPDALTVKDLDSET